MQSALFVRFTKGCAAKNVGTTVTVSCHHNDKAASLVAEHYSKLTAPLIAVAPVPNFT